MLSLSERIEDFCSSWDKFHDDYRQLFFDYFPEEEDHPTDRFPSATTYFDQVDRAFLQVLDLRRFQPSQENIPPGIVTRIRRSLRICEKGMEKLHEEQDRAFSIWAEDEREILTDHFLILSINTVKIMNEICKLLEIKYTL